MTIKDDDSDELLLAFHKLIEGQNVEQKQMDPKWKYVKVTIMETTNDSMCTFDESSFSKLHTFHKTCFEMLNSSWSKINQLGQPNALDRQYLLCPLKWKQDKFEIDWAVLEKVHLSATTNKSAITWPKEWQDELQYNWQLVKVQQVNRKKKQDMWDKSTFLILARFTTLSSFRSIAKSTKHRNAVTMFKMFPSQTVIPTGIEYALALQMPSLPYILWRIEHWLNAGDLQLQLLHDPTYPVYLHFTELSSALYSIDTKHSHSFDAWECFGDSVLKFLTIVQGFFEFPCYNESKLTLWKSALVSNDTLFCVSTDESVNLASYGVLESFSWQKWHPPFFREQFNSLFSYIRVPFKRNADLVEAVLGVCFYSKLLPTATSSTQDPLTPDIFFTQFGLGQAIGNCFKFFFFFIFKIF
ncbi:hypothetical protein RFI_15339, partial [Reticulomyxa filosa]